MNLDIRFDFQRRDRLGLIEAIWGQDKSIDQLKRLSKNVLSNSEVVFITRINSEKAFELLNWEYQIEKLKLLSKLIINKIFEFFFSNLN